MIQSLVKNDMICFLTLHIQSEYGKIKIRKTPNTNTFYAVQLILPEHGFHRLVFAVRGIKAWGVKYFCREPW